MKINVLISFLLVWMLAGCQKESSVNDDDSYYVSFNANGVEKKYTGFAIGTLVPASGYLELQLIGADNQTATTGYMGIYINNFPGAANIGAGEYRDNSTDFTVLTTHEINGNSFEAGETLAQDAASNAVTIVPFKVVITEINAQFARGTFSGDYYENADVLTGNKLAVTNGKFYVKMQ